MRTLSNSQLNRLQRTWNALLSDICVLQARAEGSTGYGYGQPSWTNSAPVACLFEPALTKEADGSQAKKIDGYVIFSIDTSLNNLSRLKITAMHDQTLSPAQVYEIIDGPIRHHVGQKVRVALVTDGSGA